MRKECKNKGIEKMNQIFPFFFLKISALQRPFNSSD